MTGGDKSWVGPASTIFDTILGFRLRYGPCYLPGEAAPGMKHRKNMTWTTLSLHEEKGIPGRPHWPVFLFNLKGVFNQQDPHPGAVREHRLNGIRVDGWCQAVVKPLWPVSGLLPGPVLLPLLSGQRRRPTGLPIRC